jgi:hypothetical protein
MNSFYCVEKSLSEVHVIGGSFPLQLSWLLNVNLLLSILVALGQLNFIVQINAYLDAHYLGETNLGSIALKVIKLCSEDTNN